jgi:hypothetical protein
MISHGSYRSVYSVKEVINALLALAYQVYGYHIQLCSRPHMLHFCAVQCYLHSVKLLVIYYKLKNVMQSNSQN